MSEGLHHLRLPGVVPFEFLEPFGPVHLERAVLLADADDGQSRSQHNLRLAKSVDDLSRRQSLSAPDPPSLHPSSGVGSFLSFAHFSLSRPRILRRCPAEPARDSESLPR